MENVTLNKTDEIVMKLLHYFITEQGYNPIVLHGAKDEIWLENMDGSYEIIRIVTNYIHNNEQLNFDIYKTKQIMKRIKRKTFSFKMTAMTLFINLGDNVQVDDYFHINNIDCFNIKSLKDLKKYDVITREFPTITKEMKYTEKGMNLFMKITGDINKKNEETSKKAEDVFKKKPIYITYALIVINIVMFLLMEVVGNGSEDVYTLIEYGANVPSLIRAGEYYRLITCSFLHIGFVHLLCNMYCLYVIGTQIESFFGKAKFLIVYLGSAITASLLSMSFSSSVSAGASGAIFGLFGALLYFGYHYRVYLGSVIRSQIIPLILINLTLGFMLPGVDNAAHIGGLIGGTLLTMALGVKYKSADSEKFNGRLLSLIFIIFLIYVAFSVTA